MTKAPDDRENALIKGLISGLELPPSYTVSEWADARRILPSYAAEPGRWRTSRAPYQKEPMDAVNDPNVEVIVLKWASQLGKSEVLNNILGYFIDYDPAAMMFVLPTKDAAIDYSKERIQPMIDACPALRDKVAEVKARDSSNTLTQKTFPGGFLAFSGSNSPSSLASRPLRVALGDEIDKFAASIGKDGDPLKQVIQRTTNFWNRKIILSSTPDGAGLSHIDDWYEKSDQREYCAPCPDCGEMQFLDFFPDEKTGAGGVRWTDGEPDGAEYCCKHCGSLWSQKMLSAAVSRGRWIARNPGGNIAGFYINALYSPWQTMAGLAAEWEESRDRQETRQTFVNLKLGQSFKLTERVQATAAELMARAADFSADRIPIQTMLITAGVDVQADRLECQIVGWAAGEERFVISNNVIPGNPQTSTPWSALDELLARPYVHPGNGAELYVEACVVDSGYLTQIVMNYCHNHQARGNPVYAAKGRPGITDPIWKLSREKFKSGQKLWLVGVHDAKMTIYGALVNNVPGEGHINFSNTLNEEYFRQLIAEEITTKMVRGRYVKGFDARGRRNEALDTLVYATAARWSLGGIDYVERFRRFVDDQPTSPIDPAEIGKKYRENGGVRSYSFLVCSLVCWST